VALPIIRYARARTGGSGLNAQPTMAGAAYRRCRYASPSELERIGDVGTAGRCRSSVRTRVLLRCVSQLLAHHVDSGVDRHGRCRRITGPPCDIGKSGGPRRVVQDRGASQTCRLERVAGCGIIGAWRTNSAHLHRPRRATSVYVIATDGGRFPHPTRSVSSAGHHRDSGEVQCNLVRCHRNLAKRMAGVRAALRCDLHLDRDARGTNVR
jgi:hypothetical protein